MKQERKYQIIIAALCAIIIMQLLFMVAGRPRKEKKPLPPAIKGKIAIVIDDWGYNLKNLRIVDEAKFPFTASVLPRLGYSKRVAEELHNRGIEVILHLPMEPHEKYRLEKNTILTSMSEAAIIGILNDDLADIKFAKGVSNHMGSSATEDAKTMETVFKELKKRRLYFLDSFVSGKSVCTQLAPKYGIAFIKRDIFLDNQEDPVYIRSQLEKLKLRARRKGYAVGIGHDRRVTLETLKEAVPELEKEGYKFVFLSDLLK